MNALTRWCKHGSVCLLLAATATLSTGAIADIVLGSPELFTEGGAQKLRVAVLAEAGTSFQTAALEAEVLGDIFPDGIVPGIPGFFPGGDPFYASFIPINPLTVTGPTPLLTWTFALDPSGPDQFPLDVRVKYYDANFSNPVESFLHVDVNVSAVPEPSAVLLLIAGLGFLAVWHGRRHTK